MEITIYAKKRTTREGKTFYNYLSRLNRRDETGEIISQIVSVKFREDAGTPKPENCPMNIEFPKQTANLSSRNYTREDTGETGKSYTLWISEWEPGTPFVDHSLDDFE